MYVSYLRLCFFFKHTTHTMIATMVMNPVPPTITGTMIPVDASDVSEMKITCGS